MRNIIATRIQSGIAMLKPILTTVMRVIGSFMFCDNGLHPMMRGD